MISSSLSVQTSMTGSWFVLLADSDGLGLSDSLCFGPGRGNVVSMGFASGLCTVDLAYCSTGLVSVTTLVSVSVL